MYAPCIIEDNACNLNIRRYGVALFVSRCGVNRSQCDGLAVNIGGGKILCTVIGFGDVLTVSICAGYIGVSILGVRLRNVSPGQTLAGVGSCELIKVCGDLSGRSLDSCRSQVDTCDFLNEILDQINRLLVETAETAYDETEKLVNHVIVECHCLKQVIYDSLDVRCFSSSAETVIEILDECDRLVTGCKELENAGNCVVDDLVKLFDGSCGGRLPFAEVILVGVLLFAEEAICELNKYRSNFVAAGEHLDNGINNLCRVVDHLVNKINKCGIKRVHVNLEKVENCLNVLGGDNHIKNSEDGIGLISLDVLARCAEAYIPFRVNNRVGVDDVAVCINLSSHFGDVLGSELKIKSRDKLVDCDLDSIFKGSGVKVDLDADFGVMNLNIVAEVKLCNTGTIKKTDQVNIDGYGDYAFNSLNELVNRSDKVGNDGGKSVLAYGVGKVCDEFKNEGERSVQLAVDGGQNRLEDVAERTVCSYIGFIVSLSLDVFNTEGLEKRNNCVVVSAAAHEVDFLEYANGVAEGGSVGVIYAAAKQEFKDRVERLEKVADDLDKLVGLFSGCCGIGNAPCIVAFDLGYRLGFAYLCIGIVKNRGKSVGGFAYLVLGLAGLVKPYGYGFSC